MMRSAMSSGCSTKLVVESSTPGIRIAASGSSCCLKSFHSCSWRGLAPSNENACARRRGGGHHRETGQVRIERLVVVDDCGTVVNPLIVHGQIAGGVAQGLGEALYERIEFGEDGTAADGQLAGVR